MRRAAVIREVADRIPQRDEDVEIGQRGDDTTGQGRHAPGATANSRLCHGSAEHELSKGIHFESVQRLVRKAAKAIHLHAFAYCPRKKLEGV